MSEGTFEMVTDDGFDAAVEAQIAAATGTPEPAPVESEPEPKVDKRLARERDEHGRYKPAVEPEQEAETEPESQAPAADPVAELKAQFEALEARLIEKDNFIIGRLSNELGQLRQQVPQASQAPQAAASLDALTEQIAESPSLGASYASQALSQGDWDTYDTILDIWGSVDPRGARRYERQVNVWLAGQQAEAQTAPLAQSARETQNARALLAMSERYPDFPQVIASLEQEGKIPAALEKALLEAPNQAAYEEGLDTLYNFLKGKQAGPLAEVVRVASEAERAEARQAKVDATVASASASPVREEPLTMQEQIVKEWADLEAPFANPWST